MNDKGYKMKSLLDDLFELSNAKIHHTTTHYHRFLYDTIVKDNAKFAGIYGARGVGKTTMLLQIAKAIPLHKDEILYISCDHPLLVSVELFELVQEFVRYGGKFILIDEIHEAPDFERSLKSIYDFLDVRVLFSGSSAVKLTNPSFARRYAMYHLPFLSFREYLELSLNLHLPSYALSDILKYHTDIAVKTIETLDDQKILKLFEEFLKVGAYPFYFENRANYAQKILDSVNTVLYTDLGMLYNISAEKAYTLKKLLTGICLSQPMELSMERLAKLAGISKTTLYKYIEILHRAELLRHILYEGKRFKSIQKPDKLYLANTTLLSTLCLHPKRGTLRESFFASQVQVNHSLYYVDRGDFLVDETYTFEIGGKRKEFYQIEGIDDAYVAADGIETGFKNKIPLWLFGFLY